MKLKTSKCLGIPVRLNRNMKQVSNSRGIWPFQRIHVGPMFFSFPPREQEAILLHEVGHCKLKHLEQRIRSLWMLFWRPAALLELCVQQEYQADRYAASCGYGPDLARAFLRMKVGSSPLHPPLTDRVSRLIHTG